VDEYLIKKIDKISDDLTEIKTTQAIQTNILANQQLSIDYHILRTDTLQNEVAKILTIKKFIIDATMFSLKVIAVLTAIITIVIKVKG